MAGWFSRRSGSRVSIHNAVRRVLRALSLSRNPMPPRTTSRKHHESAEKETQQSLVPLLGLDGKHLVFCRRRGGICLDIPFYRTALPETGFSLTVFGEPD